MKILKKGGRRKRNPCPMRLCTWRYTVFRLIQYKIEGKQLHFHISRHIAHLGWETPVFFYTFYLVCIWHCRIKLKEWFIWKFWKKGGGGNEIHAPCACAHGDIIHTIDTFQHQSLSLMSSLLEAMYQAIVEKESKTRQYLVQICVSWHIFCSPTTGFEHAPLIHSRTNRIELFPNPLQDQLLSHTV
jgi:hypothetical protein